MAITLVGQNSAVATSGTASITHGLTINENDFVVVEIACNGTVTPTLGSFTACTGYPYTQTNSSATKTIAYKQATASEPASYSFTLSGSDRWLVIVSVFRGSTALAWDVEPSPSEPVTATSMTIPEITTLTANTMLVAHAATDSATVTYSALGNGFGDLVQNNGGQSGFVASKAQASASATGGVGFTLSSASTTVVGLGALKETAPSYTITSIDGDNNVQAGQSNVSIVTSGIDPASVTQAVTLGGETLTINSWTDSGGNALINVDIPLHINAEWGTTHELAVTHDGGTTTLSGVTLSAPTGWETVSFSTIPDTGTTESFYEYSQSDATVGNFTAQVGDTLAFTSSTGLTIDGSSIPVVNPAATVTGSYKWWDASLSTWTPVSSYTITNLGVFGGSDTTVMIQEMISDMISEMVN